VQHIREVPAVAVSTVCCSVLQCVAMCCSVLQCVAVCCSMFQCCGVFGIEQPIRELATSVVGFLERMLGSFGRMQGSFD